MGSSFGRALAACACILSFITAGAPALAQTVRVDVKGTVSATDGTPIAGATVTLTSEGVSTSERTDKRGRYKFKKIAAGTYSIVASAPRFSRLSGRTVTVSVEEEIVDLTLSPATTNSLTVIGHVRAISGETVSTSSAPVADLSAQSAAASGVTAVAPMVWTQLAVTPIIPLGGGSNATVSFAVRGPDPSETLVDIDGHPVNNGNTGDADLSLLDPAALQEVQVIYGISPASLLGPNQIGGAINVQTLQPTTTPHALLRIFGGSFGSFGETAQATGTDGRIGYAVSVHGAQSDGSVNQTILAASPAGAAAGSGNNSLQSVGSGSFGDSLLGKLRYQLGGENGYGYLQLSFRGQNVWKDDSALLTTYTPPNCTTCGGGGDDARPRDDANPGGYQSFAGTSLSANQFNYGFDALLPLGNSRIDGVPDTFLQFSHLTTLNGQSVGGPGEATQQYLYNQRDALGDDWLQLDRHYRSGDLSFKYDLGTEALDTNFVQGQVVAHVIRTEPPTFAPASTYVPATAPTQVESLAQVQRSAVLRYSGDPSSQIHYSLETYFSNFSTFGSSFDPRAGFTWTPTGNSALRASVGTTFQAPQLSELVVPPLADRVAVNGIVYTGNPTLQPDRATDYDLGGEQIFGRLGHQLRLTADVYQNNVRSQSSQLNVDAVVGCNPHILAGKNACPVSMPVNAGDARYRGIDLTAEQQLGEFFRVRAGWDVDSSFLTNAPANVQDGTLVVGEQTLGQPLHKAYVGFDRDAPEGFVFGASLNYEGFYNELNRSPYASLDAHVAYRTHGFEFGLYGTNLTNAYAQPYAIAFGGVPYGTVPGNAPIYPTAYALQGSKVVFVVTRSI